MNFAVSNLLTCSLATSTRHSYRAAFQSYREFHLTYYKKEPDHKISPKKLVKFIAFCHSKGLKHTSISSKISALNYINKLYGHHKAAKQFVVQKMLKGCKKFSNSTDSRKPITRSILKNILKVIPEIIKTKVNVYLYSAMFLLAFYALLRVSEITQTRSSDHAILHQGLTIHTRQGQADRVTLVLRHSKQSSTPTPIHLNSVKNSAFCPVKSLVNFLTVRPAIPGQLFISNKGYPITSKQFSKVLTKCIRKIGLSHRFLSE